MASSKTWNRRGAVIGGVSLAAGVTWALREPSGTSRSGIPGKDTLRRGNAAEPETLDNSLASSDGDDNIIGDLMVGLVTEDIGARPIAGMATEWKTSPDGLIWNFKLREAVWSDGVPVTASVAVIRMFPALLRAAWKCATPPAAVSTRRSAGKTARGSLLPSWSVPV